MNCWWKCTTRRTTVPRRDTWASLLEMRPLVTRLVKSLKWNIVTQISLHNRLIWNIFIISPQIQNYSWTLEIFKSLMGRSRQETLSAATMVKSSLPEIRTMSGPAYRSPTIILAGELNIIWHSSLTVYYFDVNTVWGGRLCKRFCNILTVSSRCLLASAVQPSCLWNSQKTCYKTFSST